MKVREQLEEDQRWVKRRIISLEIGPNQNLTVVGADYLRPTLYGLPIPLDNPDGAYVYFKTLDFIIGEALLSGNISALKEKAREINLPEYLRELMEA
ncbi:hypothetical protein HYZ76_01290 [Candidatus Falkowbacteria bacterium]|nr:hypothetical protein [Candidatus Falkowbacteria bacterium]